MREAFHADIDELLVGVFDAGRTCDEMLTAAVAALRAGDRVAARAVAERDHEIDRAHQETQRTVLGLLALQAPVASDLRRLVAILQVSVHVERLGDYATQIARTVERLDGGIDDERLGALLGEMAEAAVDVSQAALRSLVRMDTDLAWRLPSLDDRVDAANRDAFSRLVGMAAADEAWSAAASHLVVAARSLERYGDHAVDIGEQTILAATGRIVELSSNALDGEHLADGIEAGVEDLVHGGLRIDARRGLAWSRGRVLELPPRELRLLVALVTAGGATVPRPRLAEAAGVTGAELEPQLGRLQARLAADGAAVLERADDGVRLAAEA